MSNDTAWINDEKVDCEFSDYRESPKYRCHVAITKDADDLYSAIVLNLPGAGTSGSSAEEALSRVPEAVRGVIAAYRERGREIPWLETSDYKSEIPNDCEQKWILVDA